MEIWYTIDFFFFFFLALLSSSRIKIRCVFIQVAGTTKPQREGGPMVVIKVSQIARRGWVGITKLVKYTAIYSRSQKAPGKICWKNEYKHTIAWIQSPQDVSSS